MTRRLPAPWRDEKVANGYVVRDATGLAIAHVYGRLTEADEIAAKQLTMDETRRVAANIARLPGFLGRSE